MFLDVVQVYVQVMLLQTTSLYLYICQKTELDSGFPTIEMLILVINIAFKIKIDFLIYKALY